MQEMDRHNRDLLFKGNGILPAIDDENLFQTEMGDRMANGRGYFGGIGAFAFKPDQLATLEKHEVDFGTVVSRPEESILMGYCL